MILRQVDGTRMLDSIENGRLGDLVEDNAPGVLGLESEHLEQMPCDGLSLAVFITCKPHDFTLRSLILEFLDLFHLVFGNLIQRREAMLHVDTEILLVQVSDVTET